METEGRTVSRDVERGDGCADHAAVIRRDRRGELPLTPLARDAIFFGTHGVQDEVDVVHAMFHSDRRLLRTGCGG